MTKKICDFFFAFTTLSLLSPLLLLGFLISCIDTRSVGLFSQLRIGENGIPFKIFKLKTMLSKSKKITTFGHFFRRTKIDELPQLINIVLGQMSFVGPRPDIPGYADLLKDDERLLLSLKPGITGLASLKYRREELLLSVHPNPMHYNDTVIWPDKVRINNWYAQNLSFWMDLQIIFYTVLPFVSFDVENFIRNYRTP